MIEKYFLLKVTSLVFLNTVEVLKRRKTVGKEFSWSEFLFENDAFKFGKSSYFRNLLKN